MKRLPVLMLMMVAFAAMATSAKADPFTPGNIVIVHHSSYGANTLAAAASLREYTPTGTLVQTLPLPTTVNGAHRRLTLSGREAILSRSTDGRYLTLGGHDAAVGTVTAGTDTVIGRIDAAGVIDTTTALTDAFNGSQITSVASDDGTRFWLSGTGSGGANPTNGVKYATLGATSSIRVAVSPANALSTKIFDGQLYVSSQEAPHRGINRVGNGLPTTGGQTVTNLVGTGGTTVPSPTDFFLAAPDLLYVCDTRRVSDGGGLQRWEKNGATWTLDYTLSLGNNRGCYGLAGSYDEGTGFASLFATTTEGPFSSLQTNDLVAITDTGPDAVFSHLATAVTTNPPNGTAFLGVAFAPVPEPSTLSLLLLAGPIAWRRRRSCPGS